MEGSATCRAGSGSTSGAQREASSPHAPCRQEEAIVSSCCHSLPSYGLSSTSRDSAARLPLITAPREVRHPRLNYFSDTKRVMHSSGGWTSTSCTALSFVRAYFPLAG